MQVFHYIFSFVKKMQEKLNPFVQNLILFKNYLIYFKEILQIINIYLKIQKITSEDHRYLWIDFA